MKNYHFVVICRANACRSPVGEALLRLALAKRGINAYVESYGVFDEKVGMAEANPHSIALVRFRYDMDISHHRRRHAKHCLWIAIDRIFVMDDEVRAKLINECNAPSDKIEMLCAATGGVPNPFVSGKRPEEQDMANYLPMVEALSKEAERIAEHYASLR